MRPVKPFEQMHMDQDRNTPARVPGPARIFLLLAALLGALAVMTGAFGAHALKARLAPDLLAVWHTAVQYHFWHALALSLIGVLALHLPGSRALHAAGWLMMAGLLVFSGSLYVLALSDLRGLGAITPFGGVALIAGWLTLAWALWRH